MNTRVISLIYGVTFIAVGLLGFIPNPLVSSVGFLPSMRRTMRYMY